MTDKQIESLISVWSMRPPPLSSEGRAWEDGARQGWKWALAAAKAAEGWQPISTAPKTGQSILLCHGRWITAGHWHRSTAQWSSSGPVYSPYPKDEQPTHWQPLPAPPSSDENK